MERNSELMNDAYTGLFQQFSFLLSDKMAFQRPAHESKAEDQQIKDSVHVQWKNTMLVYTSHTVKKGNAQRHS